MAKEARPTDQAENHGACCGCPSILSTPLPATITSYFPFPTQTFTPREKTKRNETRARSEVLTVNKQRGDREPCLRQEGAKRCKCNNQRFYCDRRKSESQLPTSAGWRIESFDKNEISRFPCIVSNAFCPLSPGIPVFFCTDTERKLPTHPTVHLTAARASSFRR